MHTTFNIATAIHTTGENLIENPRPSSEQTPSVASEYADHYNLNDIGLALRLHGPCVASQS